MANLLLGNGIDIQFGGLACTSSFIIKRIKYRALLDSYAELFGYQLSSDNIVKLLEGFVCEANSIIHGEYDSFVHDADTQEALDDFKNRYKDDMKTPDEIMLEDWLFIVHMFFLKNDDLEENRNSAVQGFERLLLDAIYNDGLVQDIHKNMPKSVKKYLRKYDAIFTLNYDNNVEFLIGKEVYHLHGDFSELADSENNGTVNGFLRMQTGQTVYQDNMKHCYCNALLNYSGKLKKKRIDECTSANEALESLVLACTANDAKLLELQSTNQDTYEMVLSKIEHEELRAASDYHYKELCEISGELHIIGMSPNNDAHIFEAVLNNKNLTKAVFYYRDPKHKEFIEREYPGGLFECQNVNSLWKKLNCENPTLNCSYTFPKEIDDFVRAFNELSMDEISTDEVKTALKQITRSEMKRLCLLVKEDINKRNPELKSTDAKAFIQQNASISYIGLQQGVLPTVLYLICVMNFEYIKD
ncbi:MAG: hypothetical protein O0V67_07890 [Methanocorpusculum sp.]|nr:hypothetical protein [Methanocorpusculum sp.]